MFGTYFLRPLVTAYVVWRNPHMTTIARQTNRWTPRQLYLEAKGERAQRKVLRMAVRDFRRSQTAELGGASLLMYASKPQHCPALAGLITAAGQRDK
jgi:hypothetical protein